MMVIDDDNHPLIWNKINHYNKPLLKIREIRVIAIKPKIEIQICHNKQWSETLKYPIFLTKFSSV